MQVKVVFSISDENFASFVQLAKTMGEWSSKSAEYTIRDVDFASVFFSLAARDATDPEAVKVSVDALLDIIDPNRKLKEKQKQALKEYLNNAE